MRPATTTRDYLAEMMAEFLMAYLLTLNQLGEMRQRVEGARNEEERRKSLFHLRNARRRCNVLRSLVSKGGCRMADAGGCVNGPPASERSEPRGIRVRY